MHLIWIISQNLTALVAGVTNIRFNSTQIPDMKLQWAEDNAAKWSHTSKRVSLFRKN